MVKIVGGPVPVKAQTVRSARDKGVSWIIVVAELVGV